MATACTKVGNVESELKRSLKYIMNPEKTVKSNTKYKDMPFVSVSKGIEITEREYFVEGINCIPENAFTEFNAVKRQFDKTDGKLAQHVTISFEETDIEPELAHKAGREFAKMVWGDKYQVVMATHMNSDHLHCHFVVNSVSFVDGVRWHPEYMSILKDSSDKVCIANNLSYIERRSHTKSAPYYARKLDKENIPTKYNIMRAAIDYSIEYCHSYADFEYILKQLGYSQKLSPNGFWMLEEKCDKKAVKLVTLGKEYLPERIRERIQEKKGINFKSFTSPVYFKKAQYGLAKREDKILQKENGLKADYLIYLTKLGFFHMKKISILFL